MRIPPLEFYWPEQPASPNAIKHQRDKQIIFVHRADIQLFNLSEGYQYSSSLKKFIYIDYQHINPVLMKFAQTNRTVWDDEREWCANLLTLIMFNFTLFRNTF